MAMNAVQEISVELVKDTDNDYIVRATILTSEGVRVAMLGEGKSADEAENKAVLKAVNMARNASYLLEETGVKGGQLENEPQVVGVALAEATYGSRHDNQGHQSIEAGRQQIPQDKANLNGGGAKDASPKQKEFIRDLARKRGRNVEELCQSVCNCSFQNLQGKDANDIITAIQGK